MRAYNVWHACVLNQGVISCTHQRAKRNLQLEFPSRQKNVAAPVLTGSASAHSFPPFLQCGLSGRPVVAQTPFLVSQRPVSQRRFFSCPPTVPHLTFPFPIVPPPPPPPSTLLNGRPTRGTARITRRRAPPSLRRRCCTPKVKSGPLRSPNFTPAVSSNPGRAPQSLPPSFAPSWPPAVGRAPRASRRSSMRRSASLSSPMLPSPTRGPSFRRRASCGAWSATSRSVPGAAAGWSWPTAPSASWPGP